MGSLNWSQERWVNSMESTATHLWPRRRILAREVDSARFALLRYTWMNTYEIYGGRRSRAKLSHSLMLLMMMMMMIDTWNTYFIAATDAYYLTKKLDFVLEQFKIFQKDNTHPTPHLIFTRLLHVIFFYVSYTFRTLGDDGSPLLPVFCYSK